MRALLSHSPMEHLPIWRVNAASFKAQGWLRTRICIELAPDSRWMSLHIIAAGNEK